MTQITRYTRTGETKQTVKIGDYVSFKSDVEQSGRCIAIKGDWLVLENKNGFSGDYIGHMTETEQHVSNCWLEG